MGPVAMAPQAAATVQLVAAMVLLVAAGAATVLLEGVVALLVGGGRLSRAAPSAFLGQGKTEARSTTFLHSYQASFLHVS